MLGAVHDLLNLVRKRASCRVALFGVIFVFAVLSTLFQRGQLSAASIRSYSSAQSTCTPLNPRQSPGYQTAYLFMVHSDERLEGARQIIEQIYDEHDLFIIHADLRINQSTLEIYKEVMTRCRHIEFISEEKRLKGKWASWDLVAIEMLLLEHALASPVPWQHTVLLDGSAWPIGNQAYRQEWLHRYDWLSKQGGYGEGPTVCLSGRCSYRQPSRCVDDKCTAMTLTPGGAVVRKRWQFFILNRDAAEYVHHGADATEWNEFFQQTKIPDEHQIVTVQYAQPGGPTGWLPQPVKVFWRAECRDYPEPNTMHPCRLGMRDVPAILESGHMFARKIFLQDTELRRVLVQGEPKSITFPIALDMEATAP